MTAPTPRRTPPATWAVFVLLFLAAAWVYVWSPASFPTRWVTREPASLYAELAAAHLSGQLALQREPDPRMLALADPYDPVQNAAYRVNDVSFRDGRYYLYHGVSPVLVLYTPFRIVTGRHLTDAAAALAFCLGAAAASLLLLADLARRNAVPPSRLLLVACGLVAVLGNGYHFVLRGPGIHQVAIAGAQCFLLFAIWCAVRALDSERASRWLFAAATAYGLAIAARPNYVFGAVALLIPLFVLIRRPEGRAPAAWGRHLLAVGLPLAVIIGGMLLHNLLRFGHPLEFGQRYQLGAWDQRHLGVFGLKYLGVNAWHYLLDPGRLSLEFPFITAPSWQAVGLLVHSPFAWLAVATLGCLSRGAGAARSLAGLLALAGFANLGLLLFLPSGNDAAVLTSANARYVFDFSPPLLLLAAAGAIATEARLAARPLLQRTWRALVVLLALGTLLGSLSLDLQHFPAESYRQVSQVLNRPGHLVSRWFGTAYGPVEYSVTLPPGRIGQYEPLLATGTSQGSDLLYAFYDSQQTVRFGLVGTTMRGPLSPPIPVVYGQPYKLEVAMGSLYPSIGNPLLASFSEAAIAGLKRTLRIKLDGQVVFEVPAHFFPAKPRQVYFGRNPHLEGYSAEQFTGRLAVVSRPPITVPDALATVTDQYGPVRMRLRFPREIIGSEPLLVTGLPQAGDFAYISHAGPGAFVIGYDHWGVPGRFSKTLFTDFSTEHVVEITMGSLYPPRGHVFWKDYSPEEVERLKRTVQIKLDGVVVMEHEQEAYESSPYDVRFGRNILGGSTCGYEFSGEILATERMPVTAR